MPDYWRKSPHVKNLVFKVITDDATRFAALQTGEVDFVNVIPGALLNAAEANPNFTLAQVSTAPLLARVLEWQDPANPFNDIRVRQAPHWRSTAGHQPGRDRRVLPRRHGQLDPRQPHRALTKDETKPEWSEYNLEKARALMAEAGYPNGFDVPS
jgi:ABC-type transport system substrate-binding protein